MTYHDKRLHSGERQAAAANGIADNKGRRCVPDAAMDADPQSGYSIICAGEQVRGCT